MASEISFGGQAFPDRLIYCEARARPVCVCKTISLSCLPKSHHFSLKCVYRTPSQPAYRSSPLALCFYRVGVRRRRRRGLFLQSTSGSFLSLSLLAFYEHTLSAQIELFPNVVLVYVLAKVHRAHARTVSAAVY
jgi:hypothetical protein